MAKNASGNAFIKHKKQVQEHIMSRERGLDVDELKDEDVFELQHHHLLTCLEKTTVSTSHSASERRSDERVTRWLTSSCTGKRWISKRSLH